MTILHESISLDTPTGTMQCRISRPTRPGKFPAIILYSEIFQITDPIARTADFYAGHGYVVITPEVFHELNPLGTVLCYDDQGKDKGNSDKATKPLTDHDADTEAILNWVANSDVCTSSVASFGMCLGGHLALRAALNPRVQAASCLYATDVHSGTIPKGTAPQTLDRINEIKGEVVFVWGRQDPHVPAPARVQLYNTFNTSDLNFSWHEINGQHAFIRDIGDRYDPELAALTQRLTLDLFHRTLR